MGDVSKCVCTMEPGDRDCAVHPSCCGCGMDLSGQRIVADRDDLRTRLAAVEAERDHWSLHARMMAKAADTERSERDTWKARANDARRATAEEIAAWCDELDLQLTIESVGDRIRAKWCGKEGK